VGVDTSQDANIQLSMASRIGDISFEDGADRLAAYEREMGRIPTLPTIRRRLSLNFSQLSRDAPQTGWTETR